MDGKWQCWYDWCGGWKMTMLICLVWWGPCIMIMGGECSMASVAVTTPTLPTPHHHFVLYCWPHQQHSRLTMATSRRSTSCMIMKMIMIDYDENCKKKICIEWCIVLYCTLSIVPRNHKHQIWKTWIIESISKKKSGTRLPSHRSSLLLTIVPLDVITCILPVVAIHHLILCSSPFDIKWWGKANISGESANGVFWFSP